MIMAIRKFAVIVLYKFLYRFRDSAFIRFSQYIISPMLMFLIFLSICGGFVLLIRLIKIFLEHNITPSQLMDELRISLIALGASLGVPFVVWRTLVISINSKISERAHQTDMYFQATQRLGEIRKDSATNTAPKKTRNTSENLSNPQEGPLPDIEVRVGSIFALYSLLQISDEYYWPSIQTLSTYIELNESTPIDYMSEADRNRLRRLEKAGQHRSYCETYVKIAETCKNVRQCASNPRADVQAALSVLTSKEPPNFSSSIRHIRPVLAGRNLQKANLKGANLTSASLQYVFAEAADLRHAVLDHCNLYRARFDSARMRGVSLFGANLAGAVFAQLDIRGDEAGFQQQLKQAFGDVWTVLPSGIERPDHWVSEIQDWRDLHDAYHAWSTERGRFLTARY
jgi:hypothetical protein